MAKDRQLLEEEKQRREKERFDREELDGANFQKLLVQSNKWKQSQILDEYISEIENNAILTGVLTKELQELLRLAIGKADRFNPLNDFLSKRLS
jgi:ribosomal protein S18